MPLVCTLIAVALTQAYAKPAVKKVDGYTFVSTPRPANRYDRQATLIVKDRNGKTLLTIKDYMATFEWAEDISGDGVKTAALSAYSGGAHCCETDYFLRLGNHPKLVGRYEMGNVSGIIPTHHTGRKGKDIVTSYDGFAYYHASYADSARVPMIFVFRQGKIVEATREFRGDLLAAYNETLKAVDANIKDYERSLVNKEITKGGLFDNDLGGMPIQAYAISLLLGNEKSALQTLSTKLGVDDYDLLVGLKKEIAGILESRASRLTYPSLPYVHDGDAP